MNSNPYVFIVGCQRSGNTLLRRIVDAHPSIAVTPETHWITRFAARKRCVTADGFVTPTLIKRLLEYHRFSKLQIDEGTLRSFAEGAKVSYSAFVTTIFNFYGTAHGKPLVGDKTPAYVRSIPTLHKLWPDARFVHVIRDGRNVCLSIKDWASSENRVCRYATWHEDPISTMALWWKLNVELGLGAAKSLPPKLYYELRYEDLVQDPGTQCEALCEFLDVPYDEDMLRFHEGRTRVKEGLSSKDAWLPVTAGLRDWRSQMTTEEVERFEAVAGDLLGELGYARATPSCSGELRQHASLMHQAFTHDARSNYRHMLPEGW